MAQYPVMEILYEELGAEPFACAEPTIYAVLKAGVRFEFLVKRQPESTQAVVFGTGRLTLPREKWPFFSRHSWMRSIPCSCVFYFDPTLYLGDIDLGWCYGTNNRWYLEEIAGILAVILRKLGVAPENAVMTGSSGGGFTSILLATLLRSRCLAINPQTDFRQYWKRYVDLLAETVLLPGESWIEERVNAAALIRREGYFPYIHILQNIDVRSDLDNHILPFVSALNRVNMNSGYRKLRIEFYSHPEGHNGMPPNDACVAAILEDLQAAYLDSIPVEKVRSTCSLSGKDLTAVLSPDGWFDPSSEFAFYLYRDQEVVDKSGYSRNSEKTWRSLVPGKYRVKVFVKTGQMKQSFYMDWITVP